MADLNVRREVAVRLLKERGNLVSENGTTITFKCIDGSIEAQELTPELSNRMLNYMARKTGIPRQEFFAADKGPPPN